MDYTFILSKYILDVNRNIELLRNNGCPTSKDIINYKISIAIEHLRLAIQNISEAIEEHHKAEVRLLEEILPNI